MLSDGLVELLGEYLAETYRAVELHYLKLMGAQIREIGTVGPAALHQLQQLMRTGANADIIQKELAAVTGKNAGDIAKILERAAQSAYGDAAPYYEARGISQAPIAQNAAMTSTVRAIERVTLQTFANLSQTTAIRGSYAKAIDAAVAAVHSGVADYMKGVRGALREAAREGLRVEYASGHTRRLDSAVRQNVLDGVRAVNQAVRDEAGRQFGADGVEISAHGMCAADHEPYQGRQYSHREYAEVQGGLHRQIGTWNCGHRAFPIILGVSAPAYSREELKDMYDDNHTPVEYGGKTYATKYEATQEQRRIETAIRYGEDVAHLADAAGDTVPAAEYRAKLKVMNGEYRRFSSAAGLKTRGDRIRAARQRFMPNSGAQGGLGGTMGARQKLIATLHTVEESRKTLTHEVGTIIDRKGNIIKEIHGASGHIDPTPDERKLIKGNIFTHNHPSGGTFSFGDIKGFVDDEAFEVRASTPQGAFYSFKSSSGKVNPVIVDSMKASGLQNSKLAAQAAVNLHKLHGQGNFTKAMWGDEMIRIMDTWLKDNAEKYGYVYTTGVL